MQNIVCPSCGSEKVTILENEKGVCLSCDSVFNIHNYSKEFQKTASHMDENHAEAMQELKNTNMMMQELKEIQNRSNREVEDYERLLEKAQTYVKLGDKRKAIETAKKATEVIPERARGYMELYRIWTNNYTLTNYYETFLNTEKTENGKDVVDALKKALKCQDCDADFSSEVVDFQKRCVQYALSDMEEGAQKANVYIDGEKSKLKESVKTLEAELKEMTRKSVKTNIIMGEIIFLVALVLFGISLVSEPARGFLKIGAIVFLIFQIYNGIQFGRTLLVVVVFGLISYSGGPDIARIVDILFLSLGLSLAGFLLIKKLNRKRNEKMSEMKLDTTEHVSMLENNYAKNQTMYEERMKEIEAKRALYNRILADTQNSQVLLNNYINNTYRS